MASPRFAVVLSGCGVFDGAEVHESVLTLLAIRRAGGTYQCFAPNVPQHHVVDHLTGQEAAGESRNVLTESARIARGNIKDLKEYRAGDFDALMLPGGFGAAKNLCTFAVDGPGCSVNTDVEAAVRETHAAGRPIGALCISPALIARVLGSVEVTIGSDEATAGAIEAMGGTHTKTTHAQVVVDRPNRVATTPCYMLDATVEQIADGATAVVDAVLAMAGEAVAA